MPRYFTHYWMNDTWNWNTESQGELLNHTAGNLFLQRGVQRGDYVYVITVQEGLLFLLGRMKVVEILDYQEAKLRLPSVWEAAEHLFGDPNGSTNMNFYRLVPIELTQSLIIKRRDGKKRPPKFISPGILDQQTLRGVTELSSSSAYELDKFLLQTDSIQNRKEESIGFIPDDGVSPTLKVGDKVVHPTFGTGTVHNCVTKNNDFELTVSFTQYGTKKLMWSLANLKKL
ncbi:MAG: hypothetical protein WCS37_07135 [Chloroflexota bacterium]